MKVYTCRVRRTNRRFGDFVGTGSSTEGIPAVTLIEIGEYQYGDEYYELV